MPLTLRLDPLNRGFVAAVVKRRMGRGRVPIHIGGYKIQWQE